MLRGPGRALSGLDCGILSGAGRALSGLDCGMLRAARRALSRLSCEAWLLEMGLGCADATGSVPQETRTLSVLDLAAPSAWLRRNLYHAQACRATCTWPPCFSKQTALVCFPGCVFWGPGRPGAWQAVLARAKASAGAEAWEWPLALLLQWQ
eukprot:scaffold248888_cov19-Tisochrysis_lutea.AAC.1